ncbi:hypothetical protein OS188_11245 [Xanthomarina sp. F1114]|uniref:hypothetical protein n=1 Tax=Xanthomarina sp. F1114 TaxID=2996019 RepID=UPI00225E1E36|nr:hypothetical protein [Xanthomarina sp. F1114]MCX7548526.1 hypothetical protein [Xanthomarina sp. F1114]
MKILVKFCLFLCLLSCGNSEENIDNVEQDSSLPSFSKEQKQKLKFTEYLLDSKVKTYTKSWVKYNELERIVDNLKQANLTYFKENHEILETFINDLKESVPEELNTPSIMSRLIALETKLYKLESVVNLSNSTPETMMSTIREVLVSFSNLNLQMNKKIERESQKIIKP